MYIGVCTAIKVYKGCIKGIYWVLYDDNTRRCMSRRSLCAAPRCTPARSLASGTLWKARRGGGGRRGGREGNVTSTWLICFTKLWNKILCLELSSLSSWVLISRLPQRQQDTQYGGIFHSLRRTTTLLLPTRQMHQY